MKNKLFALAIAVSTIFSGVPEAFAQVDYNRNPYYANNNYGTVVQYVNRIRYVTDYVNGRQEPTRNSRVISSFFSHQTVYVGRVYYNRNDGYTWYLVYEPGRNQVGWVRGDLLE